MSSARKPTRYSDAELREFQEIVQKKIDKCNAEMMSLREQISELGESMGDDRSDFVDSTISQSEGEMLRTMLYRVEKYYRDLQNAMTRIRNKSYGICMISGELIDKRRLRAVPTTTKSLEVKLKPPKRVIDLVKRENKTSTTPKNKKPVKKAVKSKAKTKKGATAASLLEESEKWQAEAAELTEKEMQAIKDELADGKEVEEVSFKDIPGKQDEAED